MSAEASFARAGGVRLTDWSARKRARSNQVKASVSSGPEMDSSGTIDGYWEELQVILSNPDPGSDREKSIHPKRTVMHQRGRERSTRVARQRPASRQPIDGVSRAVSK
ncbi:hypothetical protein NJ7G_2036 [Natrinema sp. J7-2]|nr:hypothetical protein NJ7G_2036 [Natrinema sp. J7-2]